MLVSDLEPCHECKADLVKDFLAAYSLDDVGHLPGCYSQEFY
jgi:hypothetical protein